MITWSRYSRGVKEKQLRERLLKGRKSEIDQPEKLEKETENETDNFIKERE